MNQLDLNGRVAVVTGGSSGIGEATVQRMLSSGAKVAVWDMNIPSTNYDQDSFIFIKTNVSDETSIANATTKTLERFARVDSLVNSAGVAGINAPVDEYPIDEWKRVIDINLHGTFLTCRALVPHMKDNGYGRIVNLSSVAGKEGNPTASAYSAAKAGVIALTRSLGKELATSGVLVNAVTPTTVNTPILAQVSESHIDYMKSKIPMGRLGEAQELASLIVWLCTAECSFSTAAVFDASGGRTTY
ncbi:MAG: SDR family NAD(P)-dependent oxidoreductase [Betaproteobacteria bacterium]|jgi:NAD(P)-dependent dehydrogenase (short-subunit alcohol dehydrogenase family)